MVNQRSVSDFSDFNNCIADEVVEVNGWIHQKRLLGKIIFWKLRRNHIIIDLVITDSEIIKVAKHLKTESVVNVVGIIKPRRLLKHTATETASFELHVTSLKVLNSCANLPFLINSIIQPSTTVENDFRYLVLRKERLHRLLIKRAAQINFIRTFLAKKKLLEIETPYLTTPSSEGSAEFYIPFIRENAHHFSIYSLAQSPQIYKQLLMASCFDRYFQIARCFRNEDLRTNRQPEFTQLDIEIAFSKAPEVFRLVEELVVKLIEQVTTVKVTAPFKQLTFANALLMYGSDKPDLRYEYKITSFLDNSLANSHNYPIQLGIICDEIIEKKNITKLKQICVEIKLSSAWLISANTNGDINESQALYPENKPNGSNPFPFNLQTIIKEEIKESNLQNTQKLLNIIFYIGKDSVTIYEKLGVIRSFLIKTNTSKPNHQFCPVWITDFPLFKFDNASKTLQSVHHPFTKPKSIRNLDQYLGFSNENIDKRALKIQSSAFDLVINGEEIGGGSERIYNQELQIQVFKMLGLSSNEITNTFNYLIMALNLGMPPSIGMAIGLDRLLAMINTEARSIRDVIAFPKMKNGCDGTLMSADQKPSFKKEISTIQKILKYA